MRVLVTGGAGYIGSHTTLELMRSGYEPVIFDNFSNSSSSVIDRLEKLTGRRIKVVDADLKDSKTLMTTLRNHKIQAVIHFAALKAVGESVENPLSYYDNNVAGTIVLLQVMRHMSVNNLVFSSSATVYGRPESLPLNEEAKVSPTNPYGRTKLIVEDILRDYHISNPEASISILRYFNPVGADQSGLIGEQPKGKPNNLMPYLCEVAIGERDQLEIFGIDYDTPDGTGVRDYVHVSDVAAGHIRALEFIRDMKGIFTHNLGTGLGNSVLELVRVFEEVNKVTVKTKVSPRRLGDIDACYADVSLARRDLAWEAKLTLEDMCRDSWAWKKKNIS